jgi:hypothetical protein
MSRKYTISPDALARQKMLSEIARVERDEIDSRSAGGQHGEPSAPASHGKTDRSSTVANVSQKGDAPPNCSTDVPGSTSH